MRNLLGWLETRLAQITLNYEKENIKRQRNYLGHTKEGLKQC